MTDVKKYTVGMHIETFVGNGVINGAELCAKEVIRNWHYGADVKFVVFYRPNDLVDSGVSRMQPNKLHPDKDFAEVDLEVTFIPIAEIAKTDMDVFYCNSIQHWSRWVWLPNTRVVCPLHAMNIPAAEIYGSLAWAHASASHDQHVIVSGSTVAHNLLLQWLDLMRLNNTPFAVDVRHHGLPTSSRPALGETHNLAKPKAMYLGRWAPSVKVDARVLLKAIAASGLVSQLTVASPGGRHSGMWDELRKVAHPDTNIVVMSVSGKQSRDAALASHDILLAPSTNYQENYGMSVQEAIAAGMRVIASHIGGYVDQLTQVSGDALVKNRLIGGEYEDANPAIWVDDEVNQNNKPSMAIDVPAWMCALETMVADWSQRKISNSDKVERYERLPLVNNQAWVCILDQTAEPTYRTKTVEYLQALEMMDMHKSFGQFYNM